MKRIIVIVSILLLSVLNSYGQVLINEVAVKPGTSGTASADQSLKNCATTTDGREYIELYNADPCNSVDISCYFIAEPDNVSAQGGGTFRFPPGTTIAPLGFLTIGGPLSAANIKLNNFCIGPNSVYLQTSASRWYLDNSDAYVALYDANGNALDVVYWTFGSGQASRWNNSSYPGLYNAPANVPNIAGTCANVVSLGGPSSFPGAIVSYAGASPNLGFVICRSQDGGSTWVTNAASTINSCNGTCVTSNPFYLHASITQPGCGASDGSVSFSPTPAGVYSYTWSPGVSSSSSASGLSGGSYSVSVSNGSCHKDTVIVLSAPVSPTVSINPSSPSICSGSAVVLTASGATNYTWSTSSNTSTISVSPSSTTTYTVTGATGGCSDTKTVTITVTATPTVSISGAANICSGNSLVLTASTTAGTYTWNTGPTTSTISVSPATGTTTYTLNGSNGICTTSTIATVTISPTPTMSIGGAIAICNGQSITLTGGTATSYTWSTGATTANISVSPTSNTTYTLTGTTGTCTASAVATVTVNSLPVIGSSSVTSAPCGSATGGCINSVSVSGGLPSYQYSWDGGLTWNASSNYCNIPAATYSLEVKDANGCVATTNISVPSSSGPAAPTVSPSNTIVCAGDNVPLSISPVGSYTYTWTDATGTHTGNTYTITNIGPAGNYNISVTATDAGGCISTSASLTITVNPLPTINTSASPASVCVGQSVILNASGASTYTWGANAGSVNTSTASVTPSSSDTYTVNGTSGGCTASQTIAVTVTPLPVITASPSAISICAGQSSVITASGATTFTWSSNAGGGSATTVTVSPAVTTTYTLSGTQNGCTDSSTVTITLGTPPSITVTASQTVICSGNTTTLTANGATNYTWMPGGSTGSSTTVNPAGNTIYTVSATNGGCAATMTLAVNVNATPTVSITPSSVSICSGTTTTLTAAGATNYTWLPSGSSGGTITDNPSSNVTYTLIGESSGCTNTATASINVTATPTVSIFASATTICSGQTTTLTASGAGSYTWNPGGSGATINTTPAINTTYTVLAANGNCLDSTTLTVNVNATPTVSIVPSSASICSGTTVTLTASGATNYTWLPSGSPGGSVTDNPSSNTTYTLIGESAGCANTTTTSISVIPTPTVSVTSSATTICSGQTTTLTASGATNYTWSTSATTNSVSVSPSSTTVYSVTGDNSGCGASQTFTVNVNQPATISGGVLNTATCGNLNGGVGSLTVSPAGIYTYTWTDQSTGTVVGDSLQLSGVGPGNYSLSVTDVNGCTATGGSSVYSVPAIASPTLNITPAFTQGTSPVSVTFTSNASVDVTTFNWSLGDGTITTVPNPANTYTNAGTYTVILWVDNGTCQARDTAIVVVDSPVSIIVPNIYSPNGDGINDEFFISCVGIEKLHCDIFNRWGQLVYQLLAPNDKWSGTMNNGNTATDGTYYYILDATGYDEKKHSLNGSLTLVR